MTREPARVVSLLRESDDRFRVLVDSIRDYAIFMLDPSGRVETWNTGAELVKGYKRAEILGKHFEVFFTQEDRDRGIPATLLAETEREGRVQHEGWRVRKDGTRFWAEVVITALRSDAGELIGYAKVTRDLTERRRLEDERLRRARADERFRVIVDSVKDYAIFMLSPTGHIETWNRGAELIKGYHASEIIGKRIDVFYPPGGPRARQARLPAGPRRSRWPRRGRGLAREEGRHLVLGRRRHHRAAVR